ncbi:MAG TPA: TetR/AcrR family transcriptional regulator [Candidatus Binataceae bacterium]|nr:TetR/AcrR family transcriptional regulator [Candidatus Binataceae bacterium]
MISAARLFRERGIDATGVDSITEAAGLTHGGLYSHFGSKQSIVVEAIRFALARSRSVWRRAAHGKPEGKALCDILAYYLSLAHRDTHGEGCLVAALSCDIARQPRAVRKAFTIELKEVLEFLGGLMPGDTSARRHEEAVVAFAGMVGALILARAVDDETLSRRILKATGQRLGKVVNIRRHVRRGTPKANVRASS